jgi:hypothetical protein
MIASQNISFFICYKMVYRRHPARQEPYRRDDPERESDESGSAVLPVLKPSVLEALRCV